MSMSVEDLQLLVDIVDCGGISQAAARREWSQPQVCHRVGLLQAHIGTALFRRSGKRVDASKQRVLDTVRAMAADWA